MIEGLRVPDSPKVRHFGFKQILGSLLGTGSTRFKDQRSIEYYYNCVCVGGKGGGLNGDVYDIFGSHYGSGKIGLFWGRGVSPLHRPNQWTCGHLVIFRTVLGGVMLGPL